MAKTLSEFTIADEGDDYLITLTTEEGETIELSASYARLDLIVEAIEGKLNEDEEAQLAVEGELEA